MADTVQTPTLEQTTAAELDALLGTPGSAAPAAVVEDGSKPKPDAKSPPVASPEGSETPSEEDTLIAALEAIEEEKPVEVKPDEKPALSEEQKAVLDVIPTATEAVRLHNVEQNYNNFTGALANGQFDNVQKMIEQWNPDVWEGLLEHIYEQKVASGEWVDRFIAVADGKGPTKEFTKLQKEVNELKNQLVSKKTGEEQTSAQQQLSDNLKKYSTHVGELFDQLNFNKADRRWIVADLNLRIAADPKVLAAVRGGNAKAVNALFKATCKDYINRDKEVVEQTTEKIDAQSKKKLPLGGAAAVAEGALPEDFKNVPAKDAESVASRMLDKLLGKKK
jgi:hypothetical protein